MKKTPSITKRNREEIIICKTYIICKLIKFILTMIIPFLQGSAFYFILGRSTGKPF